jgi:hypothetical protein
MKKLFFAIIFFGVFNASAQEDKKVDSIYYLLDTAKTPVLDRMISVDIARPHKFFTINCPCLNSGSRPVFRTNINNGTSISSREIAKIKFISLANLIELVRKNDTPYFNDVVAIFFIEPGKNVFIKERGFFLGGKPINMQ